MLSLQEIDKLLSLARMEIAEDEKEVLRKDIDSILAYVDQIKGAATGALPQKNVVRNVSRADEATHLPGEFSEVLLEAAPLSEDSQIKVKQIL